MERFFNTAGPNRADKEYTLDPLSRFDLDDILGYIAQAKYFVLHAPRQTGKTSCMLALRDYLNASGDYIAVYANVEGGQASRNDVQSVVKSTVDTLALEVDMLVRKPLTDGYGGPVQRVVLELKIKRGSLEKTIRDGLKQTFEYMDTVGSVDEGHLIIFDRSRLKTWDERIWHRPYEYQERSVMVWGM